MNNVHWIKPDQSHEKSDIEEGKLIFNQVLTSLQHLFSSVKRIEQIGASLIVGLLILRKPSSVNTIVDSVVYPIIVFVDKGLEVLRIQIHLFLSKHFEFSVKNFHYFDTLIVHNCFGFFVKQYWDCCLFFEVRDHLSINIIDTLLSKDMVYGLKSISF